MARAPGFRNFANLGIIDIKSMTISDMDQIEKYGLTKNEYRTLIEDKKTKAVDIAAKVIAPKKIFRFRRLGYLDQGDKWVESGHWKEDVNGICLFSIPKNFNKNDSNDCKMCFDTKKLIDYIFRNSNRKEKRTAERAGKACFEKYKDALQGTMRVGCFTSAMPNDKEMWDDPNFGDKGRGICFEYGVDDANFRPDKLAFLPVLYTNEQYDSLEAVKAVSDFYRDRSDTAAASKMVCLGYGHTLIKPTKYEKEQEWRIVIPIRKDGAHLDYFNVDQKSKRDLTSCVKAIYLGPSFWNMANAQRYMDEIENKWRSMGIPIYQVIEDNGVLKTDVI